MSILYSRVEPTLVVSTSPAYSAGDVVGGLLTIDASGALVGAILNRIVIADADNRKADFTLYLFRSAPTVIADNAAFTLSFADAKKLSMAIAIPAANYTTIGSLAVGEVDGINRTLGGGLGTIYGYLVLGVATPTYTVTTNLWMGMDFLNAGVH